jgi:tetraacyldisaccharide 4'-kinase
VTDHRPPPGPLPAPLRPLAGPLSALYRAGLEHKSGAFDAGHGVITIDRPVISVGNLSVGGTGKTPMTSWIVRTLIDAGHTPAIAMRGYRSKNGVSDEADAYARALPGTPVVAQPDRLEGLFRLFADDEGRAVDVVVLDDGFQHRRIARQLDLVLIDATRDPFLDRLLPAGWLREGPAALVRASGVVLTHTDRAEPSAIDALVRAIEGAGPPVLARSRHAWLGLDVFDQGADRAESLPWLHGRRVAVVCAVGRPESVFTAARDAIGGEPAATLALRDHDPYAASTCARIERLIASSGADTLLVTDKDWSKLAPRETARFGVPIARPRLGLAFDEGEDTLRGAVIACARTDPDGGVD